MVPVPAADRRRGIIADSQPGLGAVSHLEIVRRSGATHLCRNPAGIDRIAQNVRPASRHREGEGCHLLSEYAWLAFQRRSSQSMSRSEAPPPRCMPLLRYTRRRARSITAVGMYRNEAVTET